MDQDDNRIRRTPIPGYFCPTRRAPDVLNDTRAVNDYAGNGGIYSSGYPWGEGTRGGVIVRRNRGPLTMAAFIDGTTNCVLAGEKRLDRHSMGRFQCDDNEGYTSGWDWDVIRWGNDPPLRDRLGTDICEWRFGSSHPAGIQVVAGDGSVQIISYGIDAEVFRRLCQRDDHQPAEFP